MQLFKAFLKIAWKRLPSSLIYFCIYAVITFAIGTTYQNNMDANFQSKSLKICVIDEDHSTASCALMSYLDSIHELVSLENDPEVLQDNLYYRYISYVLTIPAGFEEKLLQGETDQLLINVKVPGSTTGAFVDQQIDQYTQTLQIYIAGGYTLGEAIVETDKNLADIEPVESLSFQGEHNEERKEVFYFYRYHPYIFIVLLFSGLAPIVILFNKKEINERTTCSSLQLTKRNLQLALSCVAYSLIVWLGFFLLGVIAYGKGMFTANALYAMLNSFVFLLISAGLTLFICNFAPSNNALNAAANIIGLGMSFLCGVFVEQSMLSAGVLQIARFLPAYWYIQANDMLSGLYTEQFSLSSYWTAIGIQLLFAAAAFVATLAASKLRRQQLAA